MGRALLAGLLAISIALTAGPLVAGTGQGHTKGETMKGSIYDFRVRTIDGKEQSLADYRGKALLIVNTASRCGFTPQYESLEKLYRTYKARGFEILAFPANDFMNQEPGSNEEIKSFCTLKYDASFPLFSKISVKGKDIAPLYSYLTTASPFPGAIGWNFTKFLVDRNGLVVARFDSRTDPLDQRVIDALEGALAATASEPPPSGPRVR